MGGAASFSRRWIEGRCSSSDQADAAETVCALSLLNPVPSSFRIPISPTDADRCGCTDGEVAPAVNAGGFDAPLTPPYRGSSE
jgi:hypothetical protein